ncbi:MAG: hypothetical protein GXP53_07815 [Deltaproteobacteria bacterium]|nr:hypothetical protein [Deltaproteobacteria bacterium]
MNAHIDFSLPGQRGNASSRRITALLIVNLIVTIVLCVFAGIFVFHANRSMPAKKKPVLSADAAKDLAVTLEQQGLSADAAEAWEDYLKRFSPGAEDAAKIWFRVGKLLQDDHKYAPALSAYYRSERIKKIDSISPDIGRRVADCLESMGKFSALNHELADRVGMKETSTKNTSANGKEVAAEIGHDKITISDIDRMIGKEVDRKLLSIKAFMGPERLKKEKENLIRQLSTASKRESFLRQYLGTELLYREARAAGLDNDPAVMDRINDDKKSILAAAMLEKASEDAIKIMPDDIATYFQAHKQEYIVPAAIKISEIMVKDAGTAKKVRKELAKGADFATLAEKYSIAQKNAGNKGGTGRWIEKNDHPDIPGIKEPKKAAAALFSAKKGEVVDKDFETPNGVCIIRIDETRPEKEQSLDEVRDRIYATIYSKKEQTVRQDMIKQLTDKYDVVIHSSLFSGENNEKNSKQSAKKTGGK